MPTKPLPKIVPAVVIDDAFLRKNPNPWWGVYGEGSYTRYSEYPYAVPVGLFCTVYKFEVVEVLPVIKVPVPDVIACAVGRNIALAEKALAENPRIDLVETALRLATETWHYPEVAELLRGYLQAHENADSTVNDFLSSFRP